MKYESQNIWRLAAIISSICLVLLLVVLAIIGLSRKSIPEYSVWPRDEATRLRSDNANVVDQAKQVRVRSVRPLDKTDHILGDAKAGVVLITYLDFECPYCNNFYPRLDELNRLYGDKLAIAVRNFPLDSHPASRAAANAFECAAEQGQWQAAMKALFEMKLKTRDGFMTMAKNLKLQSKQFQNCLDSGKYLSAIEADKAEADAAGVIGTPTSFLNGLILPGAYPVTDSTNSAGGVTQGLTTLIDKELAR